MPIKVLHIEDNSGDALLLKLTLRAAGGEFELTQAGRLSEGIELLRQGTFEIVLLDLSLPDSSGIETFRKMRESAPSTPVIVLSGMDDEASAVQTVHAGAQDYLCKDELNERLLTRSIRYAIERHRADSALDAERKLLRAVIDSLPDQIYVKDEHSRFIACNTATAKLLGAASPDDLAGKTDFDFFPQPLAEKFFAEERAVINGQPVVNREEFLGEDRGRRWLLTTKVPLRKTESAISGLVGINRDITERKRAEDQLVRVLADLQRTNDNLKSTQLQLIQAEKMESVGRLAAGVAHEVKNPLAVAVMGLDYLKNTLAAESPQYAPVLNEIYDAIKRADTVIGGLLDFSRPRTLILKPEDLNGILSQSLQLIRHEVKAKKIGHSEFLAPNLPRILLDANKLKQVFLNLLINAVHALPVDGHLTIATYTETAGALRMRGIQVPAKIKPETVVAVASVEDNGSGIAPENLNKIFEPFFTTKQPGQGTGLGLSVARQIIEMHGGVLDIRNRFEGGVRATVALPFSDLESNAKLATVKV